MIKFILIHNNPSLVEKNENIYMIFPSDVTQSQFRHEFKYVTEFDKKMKAEFQVKYHSFDLSEDLINLVKGLTKSSKIWHFSPYFELTKEDAESLKSKADFYFEDEGMVYSWIVKKDINIIKNFMKMKQGYIEVTDFVTNALQEYPHLISRQYFSEALLEMCTNPYYLGCNWNDLKFLYSADTGKYYLFLETEERPLHGFIKKEWLDCPGNENMASLKDVTRTVMSSLFFGKTKEELEVITDRYQKFLGLF